MVARPPWSRFCALASVSRLDGEWRSSPGRYTSSRSSSCPTAVSMNHFDCMLSSRSHKTPDRDARSTCPCSPRSITRDPVGGMRTSRVSETVKQSSLSQDIRNRSHAGPMSSIPKLAAMTFRAALSGLRAQPRVQPAGHVEPGLDGLDDGGPGIGMKPPEFTTPTIRVRASLAAASVMLNPECRGIPALHPGSRSWPRHHSPRQSTMPWAASAAS